MPAYRKSSALGPKTSETLEQIERIDESKNEVFEKPPNQSLLQFCENITELDLNNRKISLELLINVKLPPNLESLNMSHNNLTEIPNSIACLRKLKKLDVSYNKIIFFDFTPEFCHNIEEINLDNNDLRGPPYWVWYERTVNLKKLILSNNPNITQSFINGYFEELLQLKCFVEHLDIHNCRLNNYSELISTFPMLKTLKLGFTTFSFVDANILETFPSTGFNKCTDIETLDSSNTKIYTINKNINMYKNLKELNLSLNNISYLPKEFCDLVNLNICILSFNDLLYLPDGFENLIELRKLYLDNNKLCMLPDTLHGLIKLETLDLYNNNLYDLPENLGNLTELDCAQNYFEEPEVLGYKLQKEALRKNLLEPRLDGNAAEEEAVSEYSKSSDEEFQFGSDQEFEEIRVQQSESSCEDWDSDDYWVPHPPRHYTPSESPWLLFVQRKMREGNFCPMDQHQVPVADLVRYERLCNPKVFVEVPGQFDDLTDEES